MEHQLGPDLGQRRLNPLGIFETALTKQKSVSKDWLVRWRSTQLQ